MSKAVLISIRPKWCEKIISGEKTIEVRKTRPKMDTPFKCYIYCTRGKDARRLRGSWSKVIGEFTCDRIYELAPLNHAPDDAEQQACLTQEEIARYLKGIGYGWHISNLRIYDHPRDLWEFTPACRYKNDDGSCPSRRVACSYQKYDYNPDGSINLVECGRTLERPPQSWRYVEEVTWND